MFCSRQWTSFLAGASTAGYVYLYSFYYYFFKTKLVSFNTVDIVHLSSLYQRYYFMFIV